MHRYCFLSNPGYIYLDAMRIFVGNVGIGDVDKDVADEQATGEAVDHALNRDAAIRRMERKHFNRRVTVK